MVKGLISSLFYHSRVGWAKLTFGEECLMWFHATYEAELSTHMFLSFSYVRKQTKHQRQNSLLEDLVFLREDAFFSLFPGKLPIFLILLSRTLHLREVCVKFSRSVVSASWWPKQPTALHWFTCKTTHLFIFPDKLQIFLSLFSWTCLLLLQSLWGSQWANIY